MTRAILSGVKRGLLLLLLVLLVATTTSMMLVSTESGTRWLLEEALRWQGRFFVSYQSGSLLSGVRANTFHWHAKKFDLYARDVYLRLSLAGLLSGRLTVEQLQGHQVALHLPVPKELKETRLVRLWLPFELELRNVRLDDVSLVKGNRTWRGKTLALHDAYWEGTRARIGNISLSHERFEVALTGLIRFQDHYPLQGTGFLHVHSWESMGVSPFRLDVSRDLAQLHVNALAEEGAVPVFLSGEFRTTTPYMPMKLEADWKNVSWPWPPSLELKSARGNATLAGDLRAYETRGSMQATGKYLPEGKWGWSGTGDWGQIALSKLTYAGLGGKGSGHGKVSWANHELHWDLKTEVQNLSLQAQWPRLHLFFPELGGSWQTTGNATANGSRVLVHGLSPRQEEWSIDWQSPSWPWHLMDEYALKANWSNVVREVPHIGSVHLGEGSAEWRGPWQQHQFHARSSLDSPVIPEGEFDLSGSGKEKNWSITAVNWASAGGSGNFDGDLAWKDGWVWNGRLDFDGLDPSFWAAAWPGQLSGSSAVQGEWTSTSHRFDLGNVLVAGKLREAPVSLRADELVYRRKQRENWFPATWSASSLDAGWGNNKLKIHGGFDTAQVAAGWDARVQMDIRQPELYRDDVHGALQADLALTGSSFLPDVRSSGSLQDFSGLGVQLKRMDWGADVLKGGQEVSQVSVDASQLRFMNRDIQRITVGLIGNRASHRINWGILTPNVDAKGLLSGKLDDALNWQGQAQQAEARVLKDNWVLADQFDLGWSQGDGQLRLEPHCWKSQAASLCSVEPLELGARGHMRLKLENLSSRSLESFLPPGLDWDAEIEGEGLADWLPGERPSVRLSLFSNEGRLRLHQDSGDFLELPYDRVAVSTRLMPNEIELLGELSSPAMGEGDMTLHIDPYSNPHPLSGEIQLEGVQVGVLRPFFPLLKQLEGRVDLAGDLKGFLESPQFFGAAHWHEGKFAARRGPVAAENVDLTAEINGDRARLSGKLKSGEGSATVSAQADWSSPQWTVDGALKGQSFVVRQPPTLTASVDPDLQFHVVPGLVRVDGKVLVPSGRLIFQNSGDKVIPLSPDVVVGRLGDEPGEGMGPRNWQIITSVDVVLGDQVYFNGFDVTGRLIGGLRLRQDGSGILVGNGEVNLDEESYFRAYGQKLQIRRGRLLFAGPVNQPQLDVEAVKEVDNKVVGVRIEGRASQPQSVLISDNGLSQDEISSYLLFGRPPERKQSLFGSVDPTTGQNENGGRLAALQIGAIGGQKVADDVGQALGLRDLELATEGAGDDTRVAVGGYVAPNLYLRYGVGVFTPVNRLTLRYRLSNNFYMEAVSALESALDFFYTWKF